MERFRLRVTDGQRSATGLPSSHREIPGSIACVCASEYEKFMLNARASVLASRVPGPTLWRSGVTGLPWRGARDFVSYAYSNHIVGRPNTGC